MALVAERKVRQANALAKSGQELHVIEKRLLLVTIARIKGNDTELLTHKIPMTELEPHFGGNPYRAANKAATGLLRRVVTVKEEDGGFTAFNWTTLARYVPASQSENGGAYIEIRLNEELTPYLLQLKSRYNTIPLGDVLPMSSTNSQRLYEILWHDSFAGEKTFLTYEIADLKFQLGLRRRTSKGSGWEEKYKQWRDFQKVLSRAEKDFVKHGQLRFSFEGLKKGKQTLQVRFRVWTEAQQALPEPPADAPADADLALARKLEEAGYLQDPLKAIREYGREVVEEALRLANGAERKSARTNNPVHNLGGLIHHTLSSGLAKRALARKDEEVEAAPDVAALAELLSNAFSAARGDWANDRWEGMSPQEQSDFKDIMRLEITPIQVDQLDKSGWQGVTFDMSRRVALLKMYEAELPEHLRNLERFVELEGLFSEYEPLVGEEVLNRASEDYS